MRCPSYRKTNQKLPDIKSIWEFSGIYLNREKLMGKGKAWCYVISNKEFKGRNGIK